MRAVSEARIRHDLAKLELLAFELDQHGLEHNARFLREVASNYKVSALIDPKDSDLVTCCMGHADEQRIREIEKGVARISGLVESGRVGGALGRLMAEFTSDIRFLLGKIVPGTKP